MEDSPRLDAEPLLRASTVVICGNVSADVAEMARRSGRRPSPARLEPATLGAWVVGRVLSAADLVQALRVVHRARRALAAFHERHDLLLAPTLPEPPLPIGALSPSRAERAAVRALAGPLSPLARRAVIERLVARMAPAPLRVVTNTLLMNLTGQPAASLPLHFTPDGLPVGVQIAARFGDEATLFRVAAQLEAARPWAERRPPLIGAG
jgi:amidase